MQPCFLHFLFQKMTSSLQTCSTIDTRIKCGTINIRDLFLCEKSTYVHTCIKWKESSIENPVATTAAAVSGNITCRSTPHGDGTVLKVFVVCVRLTFEPEAECCFSALK